jgi:hypothetical protein
MARFLCAWELGVGLGHLASLAPAARGLAAHGHEAWAALKDVAAARHLPDAPFARVLPAPLWLESRNVAPTHGYGALYADGGFADEDGLAALVASWLALIDLAQPAGIVAEHAPAALLAAHVARLPAVRIGTPFTCPPATRPLPMLQGWAAPAGLRPGAADAVADRVVRNLCRQFGAPMLDGLAALLATAPAHLVSWPEMADGPRGDAVFHGPLHLGGGEAPEWPPGRLRIAVYLPHDRPMAPGLRTALAGLDAAVLWVGAGAPAGLPPHMACVPGGIDLPAALASADLFISRGGHHGALEALAAGCPQLILPDTLEAETTARTLAGQGLARWTRDWRPEALLPAIAALLAAGAPERFAARAVAAAQAGHDPAAATRALGTALLGVLLPIDRSREGA